MNDSTKANRTNWVKGLNFGGTSDWAVNLDRDYGSDGVGNLDPEKIEMGGGPQCDQANRYTMLEKISGDTSLDPTCAAQYALSVLYKMLDDTTSKYSKVNDGYDSKFKSYTKYLKKGLPDVLSNYMDYQIGVGQPYFDCHWEVGGQDWAGVCPVPDRVRGKQLFGVWKIAMTLRDSDGFYKDLNKKTGILQNWVETFTYKEHSNCQPEPCNNLDLTIVGQLRLKNNYEIPNPKDIVTKAMGNQGNLRNTLVAQTFNVGMGLWNGSNADVVAALAIPVFLMQNAIEGMEEAKELGDKEEKEEAKSKLLTILSVAFLVVPFLGEAAAVSAGATTMARVIAMIGAGANTGLALQTVIEDPNMAPFAIMDLLSLGRLKAPKDYVNAVKFRGAMKDTDISALGTKFATRDAMIQKIVRRCW